MIQKIKAQDAKRRSATLATAHAALEHLSKLSALDTEIAKAIRAPDSPDDSEINWELKKGIILAAQKIQTTAKGMLNKAS